MTKKKEKKKEIKRKPNISNESYLSIYLSPFTYLSI